MSNSQIGKHSFLCSHYFVPVCTSSIFDTQLSILNRLISLWDRQGFIVESTVFYRKPCNWFAQPLCYLGHMFLCRLSRTLRFIAHSSNGLANPPPALLASARRFKSSISRLADPSRLPMQSHGVGKILKWTPFGFVVVLSYGQLWTSFWSVWSTPSPFSSSCRLL